jgi:hypothetical protein
LGNQVIEDTDVQQYIKRKTMFNGWTGDRASPLLLGTPGAAAKAEENKKTAFPLRFYDFSLL